MDEHGFPVKGIKAFQSYAAVWLYSILMLQANIRSLIELPLICV